MLFRFGRSPMFYVPVRWNDRSIWSVCYIEVCFDLSFTLLISAFCWAACGFLWIIYVRLCAPETLYFFSRLLVNVLLTREAHQWQSCDFLATCITFMWLQCSFGSVNSVTSDLQLLTLLHLLVSVPGFLTGSFYHCPHYPCLKYLQIINRNIWQTLSRWPGIWASGSLVIRCISTSSGWRPRYLNNEVKKACW